MIAAFTRIRALRSGWLYLYPLILAVFLVSVLGTAELSSAFFVNLGSVAVHKAMLTPGRADKRDLVHHLYRAESHYRRAAALPAGSGPALRGLGRSYIAWGRLREAEVVLSRALEEEEDPRTRMWLGEVYRQFGRREIALREWRRAGADHIVTLRVGAHWFHEGDWHKAFDMYLRTTEINPANEIAFNTMSWMIERWYPRWDEMLEVYQGATQIYPADPYPHYYMAHIWWVGKGNSERAIAELEEAIALQPEGAEFHKALGDLYQALGQTDKAMAEHTLASQLDSED